MIRYPFWTRLLSHVELEEDLVAAFRGALLMELSSGGRRLRASSVSSGFLVMRAFASV